MKLTDKQQRKVEKIFKTSVQGLDAVLEHIFEVEQMIEDQIGALSNRVDTSIALVDKKASEAIIEAQDVAQMRGEQGIQGEIGIQGEKGDDGLNGKDGADGRNGIDGRDGIDGKDGRDGKDGHDGLDGKDAPIADLKEIRKELEDLKTMAASNAVPVTTSFFNGLRAKNLTIDGATAYQQGDTVHISGISSGSSSGFQSPLTGVVDGVNQTFTWTTAPNAISVDNQVMQQTSQNGDVNWVGTTSTLLTVAPTQSVFAVA